MLWGTHSIGPNREKDQIAHVLFNMRVGVGGSTWDARWIKAEKKKEEEDKVRNNKVHILPFTKLLHRKFALLRSGKKVYKFNCSLSNDELLMRQSQNWVFLVIKMLRKHCFMKCQCVSKKSLWLWNETLENEFVLGC